MVPTSATRAGVFVTAKELTLTPLTRQAGGVSRRGFLGLGAGLALTSVSGGLLTGCSGGGGGGGGPVAEQALALPTYKAPPMPAGLKVVADGVQPILEKNITEFVASVPSPPGDGSEVTTFQILWGGAPQANDKNVFLQKSSENLNVKLKPTLVSTATYVDKLATTMASGKMPDIVFVMDDTAVGMQAIDDGAVADLSEVLAGDKILEWPNLATVPSSQWEVSAKRGHIYGVPNEDGFIKTFGALRQDVMELAGHNEIPKNADDFKQMLIDVAGLGKVDGRQLWALTAYSPTMTQTLFNWMFRVGTEWQLDSAGKLVNSVETEAFADSLAYQNELWKAKVFHPDALALGTQAEKVGTMFDGGQSFLIVDAVIPTRFPNVEKTTPTAKPIYFTPPGFDGGEPLIDRATGYWGIVSISSEAAKDPARLKLLLGILNYWRSPLGSKEALFNQFGVEGVNFTFDENHAIAPTEDTQTQTDRLAVNWPGVGASPAMVVAPNNLKYMENYVANAQQMAKKTATSPVVGIYSEAKAKNGVKLDALKADFQGGLVSGRRPMTDIEELRKRWREGGGDDIRAEYEAELAKK